LNQLVKTEKPTGTAECPPHIDRAHAIESDMNEKAGTRDLDDNDIVDNDNVDTDVIDISSEDDEEPIKLTDTKPAAAKKIKVEPGTEANAARHEGPVARRIPITSSRHQTNPPGQDLLKNISNALDPTLQVERNEDRAARSFQTTQILALSNQVRDTQALLEGLRNRLSESERERYAAERRADRAEMVTMLREGTRRRLRRTESTTRRHRRSPMRQDIEYADGGRATMWYGSDESDHARDSPGTKRMTRDHDWIPPSHSSDISQQSLPGPTVPDGDGTGAVA
jgi:hypothetical protein